jgi:hypothetical protein
VESTEVRTQQTEPKSHFLLQKETMSQELVVILVIWETEIRRIKV